MSRTTVVNYSVRMVLECTVTNDSSDGSEMHVKEFIGRIIHKLLKVSHLKNHLDLVPGLLEHCCELSVMS